VPRTTVPERSPAARARGLVNKPSVMLGLRIGSVAVLIALVWLAWPRPVDTEVLAAYAQLERSPVTVKALGWISPSQARAQVLPDGYVLSLQAALLGDVTISGQRRAAPESQSGLTWQEGDVTYVLQTTADRQVVQPRIVSLEEARNQLRANALDTPVLYLGYLPAFVAFGLWATRSLLRS
jgi:hypothetical protein